MSKKLGMKGNVRRFFYQERKLIDRIDRKDKNGKYNEEDNKVSNAMTVNDNGDRVWSF